MSSFEWVIAAVGVAVVALYRWCRYLDERDEKIDRKEFRRLYSWASLIIAGTLGLIYFAVSIYGKR